MSDVRLKIRHVKRGGETKLDLSGMSLTEIPNDVFTLANLESLDISENSIRTLDKISTLQNLKNLYVRNNKISALPESILELTQLENLKLDGNPVAVMNTDLAVIFGISKVKSTLSAYFDKQKDSFESTSGSKPSFLSSSNLNDASYLRKIIADLQMEVAELKRGRGGSAIPKSLEEQKNWMSTKPSYNARPQTATSQMKKVRDLEDSLKTERQNNKLLNSEVKMLK